MFVIRFGNGTYFKDLDAERGGSLEEAYKFGSEREAKMFRHRHMWILLNGGTVVPLEDV